MVIKIMIKKNYRLRLTLIGNQKTSIENFPFKVKNNLTFFQLINY